MKTCLLLSALCIALPSAAQVGPQVGPVTVAERGPSHKLLSYTVTYNEPKGVVVRTNTLVELADGMHHWDGKQWRESRPDFEINPQGYAVALNTPHKVVIAPNANSEPLVDLLTPDGKRLRSSLIGLVIYSPVTGQSLQVAAVKDCPGLQVSPGDILFVDAFEGLKASIRIRNENGRFHQEVLLDERLTPEQLARLGFDPASQPRLEIWTEFWPELQPQTTGMLLRSETNLTKRAQMAEPDTYEDYLEFGQARMPQGTAFVEPDDEGRSAKVFKRWLKQGERSLLVEGASLADLDPLLQDLPATRLAEFKPSSTNKTLIAGRTLPSRSGQAKKEFQIAKASPLTPSGNTPQVVLDYVLETGGVTNFLFQAFTNYYVAGTVSLFGTNIIEGNCVIKFAPTNSPTLSLQQNSILQSAAGPYRMAVLTSRDDDSCGGVYPGSTGNPVRYATAITIPASISSATFDYLRFAYISTAISAEWSVTARNCQFVDCLRGLHVGGQAGLYNVLFSMCTYPVMLKSSPCGYYCPPGLIAQHVTAECHRFVYVGSTWVSLPQISLQNSVFAFTNTLSSGLCTITTNSSAFYSAGTPEFWRVGGGNYYLAQGSTNRDAGSTTGLDATLASQLKQKTTFPPLVYSNTLFSADATFYPQAMRDTDLPDRGYHYEPLDYALGGCTAEANLTFKPGVAVGWFIATSDWYNAGHGLRMADLKNVVFDGRVEAPTWWVRCNTVQEGGVATWSGGYVPGGITGSAESTATAPEIRARFLRCSMLGLEANHFRDDFGWLTVRASDSEFYAGGIGGYASSHYHTNNLFDRTSVWLMAGQTDTVYYFRHCTFNGGDFNIDRYVNPTPVTVLDSVFDRTAFPTTDGYASNPTNTVYNYNAFLAGSDRLTNSGPNIVIVTGSYNWQKGPLGSFYMPTNSLLVNAGSVADAGLVGLYHYTTTTNQVREADSPLDIGLHYLAVESDGSAADEDNDGLADCAEDADGDGIKDSGETDWCDPDSDYDGRNDADELLAGTDPNDWTSVEDVLLGYWRFNETLRGEQGQEPKVHDVPNYCDTWSDQGLLSDTGAFLKYNEVEPATGRPNLNCRRGSLRFWFRPRWTSQSAGGQGPGTYGRFLDIGKWLFEANVGQWILQTRPEGNSILFASQGEDAYVPYFEIPFSFVSNRWVQLCLTYSPDHVALYTNGFLAATMTGAPNSPPGDWKDNHAPGGIYVFPTRPERLSSGFSVGCAAAYTNDQIKGVFDELQTYNYPLSAQQVAKDFNNFGGTDATADTDYDGRTDLAETAVDGTSPTAATSAAPYRLGYWRFNSTSLMGEMGQLPTSSQNVYLSNSWSATAAAFPHSASRLVYGHSETNGWPNINCQKGAVRFWFKPDWSSGSGPSGNICFLQAAFSEPGASQDKWSLYASPNNPYIILESSVGGQIFQAYGAAEFTANKWSQIVVNYSPSNISIYKDGEMIQSSAGFTSWPSPFSRPMEVIVGNSQGGTNSIKGQIEELETFNYNLSSAAIQAGFVPMKSVDDNLNGTLDITEEIVLTSPAPFIKLPFVVTGVIEAEQFDQGGPEVAYHSTVSNPASTYRPTGLLITNCTDLGGGYGLENLRPGDWMKYTLDVRVGQTYAVEPRVSGVVSNTLIRLEFFTNNILAAWATNDLVVVETNWANLIFKNLYLPAGTNIMKISVLTNGFTGAALTNPAVRLNYTSVYPSWNEGVAVTHTNHVDKDSLSANVSTWEAAISNADAIQQVINQSQAGGVVVELPAGTYYLAAQSSKENQEECSEFNTALFASGNNLVISGSSTGETRLVAFDRATTLLAVGGDSDGTPFGMTNVSIVGLVFEGRPHLVLYTNSQAVITNYYERGSYAPTLFADNGALVRLQGAPDGTSRNILVEGCRFVNADRAIVVRAYTSNCLIRSNTFTCWTGTNDGYTGMTNTAPEPISPFTLERPPWSPSVFGLGAPNHNILVVGNTYQGNPNISAPQTVHRLQGPDGFVWFQAGGNWFVARNAITNYALEAVQVNAGPSAVVQNQFHSFVHVQANCALNAFANWPSPTGDKEDDTTCFVGNSVYGGRNGLIGYHDSHNANDRPARIEFSGNCLELFPAFDVKADDPGALGNLFISRHAVFAGNTLLAGDRAFYFQGPSTNAFVLMNNFRSVGAAGVVAPYYGNLSGIASVKNAYGRGKQHHLRVALPDAFRWFSFGESFRSWPETTNAIPAVLDPVCAPVHQHP